MNRPIIDYDLAAASIIVTGANCRLSNLVFRASVTAVVLGLDVNASDLEVDNCFFTAETVADDEFIVTVDVTSVSRFNFHDNVVETPVAAAHSTKAINLVSALDARIVNNIFRGLWSDSTIFGMTGASLRLMILDNVIYNEASGAGAAYCGIDPGALATTGIVKGNVVTALYATAVAKTFRHTATVALMWNDNSWANAVAERGVALPATSIV
jgi:hypothetical protein